MSRRERKILRRKGKKVEPEASTKHVTYVEKTENYSKPHKKQNKYITFFEKNYKKNMWITVILLIISIIVIAGHTVMYGEFIPRGVTLKGGVTLTVQFEGEIDVDQLEVFLGSEFPQGSVSVRAMSSAGQILGFIIDASDINGDDLLSAVETKTGPIEKYSLETMGSSLGEAFFKQTLIAILIAFVLMSIVVFISFRSIIPSFAVILSAVSDIAMTIAVVDIIGMKIESAGIAALLMLIGYSVDTDILLTTRVLKREGGTVFDRILGAMKTGLTMTATSIVAITVALIFTQSEVLRQIMIILLIGLIFDVLNTWLQNVGILRLYMEKKSKKHAKNTIEKFEKNE